MGIIDGDKVKEDGKRLGYEGFLCFVKDYIGGWKDK